MNRNRSYYRRRRIRAIRRKVSILRRMGGENHLEAWTRGSVGRLSKGKIHCSCWMCRSKSYDEPSARDKRMHLVSAEQLREIE